MRVKNILSLIVFAAAFAVSTALVGLTFDAGTAEKISVFLQKDVQNGAMRDAKVYRLKNDNKYNYSSANSLMSDYIAVTDEYINKSGSLDESQLPPDVQLAWLKHMKAWNNFEEFLNENQNNANDYQYRSLYRKYDREITLTWYEVLRVSKQHGATIPAGAY